MRRGDTERAEGEQGEGDALRRRDNLRVNWRAERAASWFSALADIAASSDAASPALFARKFNGSDPAFLDRIENLAKR